MNETNVFDHTAQHEEQSKKIKSVGTLRFYDAKLVFSKSRYRLSFPDEHDRRVKKEEREGKATAISSSRYSHTHAAHQNTLFISEKKMHREMERDRHRDCLSSL